MLHYKQAIIVDSDEAAAKALHQNIGERYFQTITSVNSIEDAWTHLSKLKAKTSVEVMFFNPETTPQACEFVSQIMLSADYSHIKIIVVMPRQDDQMLLKLFQHGAMAHIQTPQDTQGIKRILDRLVKRAS